MQPCQAQMPSVRLKIAVVGTGGVPASDPPKRESSFVRRGGRLPSHKRAGVGRLGPAANGLPSVITEAHAIRHHLGELARVEAAEAPTDEADLAAVGIVQFVDQIDHRVLHTRRRPRLRPGANR